MRKLIVAESIALHDVMQVLGGADRDARGGFVFGGWTLLHERE